MLQTSTMSGYLVEEPVPPKITPAFNVRAQAESTMNVFTREYSESAIKHLELGVVSFQACAELKTLASLFLEMNHLKY